MLLSQRDLLVEPSTPSSTSSGRMGSRIFELLPVVGKQASRKIWVMECGTCSQEPPLGAALRGELATFIRVTCNCKPEEQKLKTSFSAG